MNSTPIPKRMRELQRDRRGYPVPYVIMRDKTGRPHFTINDQRRQIECLAKKRCQICGKKLERTFWFVGGPQAAFHEHGGYADSMMHEECLEYALLVCPYLAMPKYLGRIDAGTLDAETLEQIVLLDHTMVPERPEVFVAVKAAGLEIMTDLTVRPTRPYLEVQYWRHGVRVSEEEGMRLGKLVRNPMPSCGECGGTGHIINDGPYSPCDDCNGTGIATEGKRLGEIKLAPGMDEAVIQRIYGDGD